MRSERKLDVGLIREIVQLAIQEGATRARTTGMLSGVVEDLDTEDFDIVHVRMDMEALGADPRESDNYGAPGEITAMRSGETFIGEEVRVNFQGRAGADAARTGIESRIVLPFGTEVGQRIVLDGELGFIALFDDDDTLVGYLDSTQWFVGAENVGRVRIDPVGGIRLWDNQEQVRVLISPEEGLQVREGVSGIVGAQVRHDGIIVSDPATGETVTITTGSRSAIPSPRWASTEQSNPSTTHSTPAVGAFQDSHLHCLDLRFVSASAASDLGAQSYTPPSGWTERADVSSSGSGVSLQTGVASKQPADADPGVENFISTSGSYTRRTSHSMVVRGDPSFLPDVADVEIGTVQVHESTIIPMTIDAPATMADGDLMVAHVCLAGGAIPVGWTVPPGWVPVGVQAAGVGTSHILGSGIWYKQFKTGDPLSEDLLINMTAAVTTKVQATVLRVVDPFLFAEGVQIRVGDRPIRRLLKFNELSSASNTLCDFTDIPQGYDNLELVVDAEAAGGGTFLDCGVRFNGDTGTNYADHRVRDGVSTGQRVAVSEIRLGRISGTAGSRTAGSVHVYGYRSSAKPTTIGSMWSTDGIFAHIESGGGQWDGASGTSVVNRMAFLHGGTAQFAAGSRAYLYGY